MDNKALLDTVAERINRDAEDVNKLVDALISVVKTRCGELDSIAVPGFGTFETKKKLERVVVNPTTGSECLFLQRLFCHSGQVPC